MYFTKRFASWHFLRSTYNSELLSSILGLHTNTEAGGAIFGTSFDAPRKYMQKHFHKYILYSFSDATFLTTAMKCPTRYGYPEKCPSSNMSNTECCYGNGTGGCCYYDGNRCHSGTTNTTRDYCPRLQDDSSQKICCVASGESSCCVSGGNRCHGNVSFRDYCPGPHEGFDKTICCSFQGQESCCFPGGNVCHDAGKNIRSYCPSPGHSLEETECCLKQDKPSCCKPPPPQL